MESFMDAKARYAVLVMSLLASGSLAAQSVGELADVQAKTLLIRAQAAQAEAQAKLVDASKSSGGPIAGDAGDSLPVVRGVYGTAGKLYATFLYANGSTVDAGRGDQIPGGFVVRSLSATRVVLGRHGQSFTVGFSDVRPLTPTPAASPAPMPPPLYAPPASNGPSGG